MDSEPLSFLAWQRTLAPWGRELTIAEFSETVGSTERMVAERYAPAVGVEPDQLEDLAHVALLKVIAAEGVVSFPDAMGLLADVRAAGLPVAVASNSPRWRLDAVLRAAGLGDLVPMSVSSTEVKRPKPAPDAYLEACRLLAVAPRACLVVEDSPTGLGAAQSAGCQVVAVDRGMFDANLLNTADVVVTDLTRGGSEA